MKSIRSKLLVIVLCIAFGLSITIFTVTMLQMFRQKTMISALEQEQTETVTKETTESLEVLEKQVAENFSDAGVKYFDEVFRNVHNHVKEIALKTENLYKKGKKNSALDDRLGIAPGVNVSDIRDEFQVISPVRDFISFLPSYDVKNLSKLDLYLMTESGMCLDGTFEKLGNSYADLRNENWYQTVKRTRSLYWSGIFTGKVTKKVKVICAMPVYDKGEFKGCAAGDMSVESFQEILEDFNKTQIESVIFFDRDGDLMHATNNYQNTDKVQEYFNSGEMVVAADNEVYSFKKLDETGWTICIVLNEEHVTKTISKIQTGIKENAEKTNDMIQEGIKKSTLLFVLVAVIGAFLTYIITEFFSRKFVKPVNALMNQVQLVGSGQLDTKIEVESKDEIGKLAEAFGQMTVDLKHYMEDVRTATAEKERIGAELNLATDIQANSLPSVFPPFPERDEFTIYASMTPAKEVGGDFYDFFLIDDDHLAMVIADVSGKGVPAALFMMISKTLLKNQALFSVSPADILQEVNNQLCENNKAEMFVTVWFSVMEISTGKIRAANAGHEFPAIRKPNGDFELLHDKHGFVLAGMEGVPYKEYEFDLEPGGTLFVYTDGVAEATDSNNVLYGTDRMLEALNRNPDAEPPELIQEVNKSIDAFVQDAPQFDDITMLSLKRLK